MPAACHVLRRPEFINNNPYQFGFISLCHGNVHRLRHISVVCNATPLVALFCTSLGMSVGLVLGLGAVSSEDARSPSLYVCVCTPLV